LPLGVADCGKQIRDLVGIHARSWDFDGAGPVEVVMAQGESQVLQLSLCQGRLVEGHKEVSWAHAALGASDGH